MATLNANALVGLDRTKEELDIILSNSDYDDQVIQYINVVSDAIELDTNRIFRQQVYTHRFTGNNKHYITLKQFPATVLTSVHVDRNWGFGASSEVPSPTETDILDEVFLIRRGTCNFWPMEPSNMQVIYTAGYATIPDGIQQAAIEWVRLIWLSQSDRRIGRSSKGKQGENASWTNDVPTIVTNLLTPYKREAVVQRALSLNGFEVINGEANNK